MQLLTFRHHDGYRLGLRTEHGVIDVRAASTALIDTLQSVSLPESVTEFYQGGSDFLDGLHLLERVASQAEGDWLLPEASLRIGPVVPVPNKIICVGLNYRRHAAETGMPPPTQPILFSKYHNAIAASGEVIPLPAIAREVDYEAELVIVIGRAARDVSEADALSYVLGYCNGNDVSARDLQLGTSQWMLGKTLDKFLPLGPYLTTADTIPDPQNLNVRCWFNGELRQNSNTSDMIFSCAQIISYISRHFPLLPGDIISTGTPEGVILGTPEKKWMVAGDHVRIEIDGLGSLVNTMG